MVTECPWRRFDLTDVRSMVDVEQAVHDGVGDPSLRASATFVMSRSSVYDLSSDIVSERRAARSGGVRRYVSTAAPPRQARFLPLRPPDPRLDCNPSEVLPEFQQRMVR